MGFSFHGVGIGTMVGLHLTVVVCSQNFITHALLVIPVQVAQVAPATLD